MEDNKQVSDQTTEAVAEVEPKVEDKVSYETFKKVLGEKKKLAEIHQKTQAQLEELRMKELEKEGKSQEVIDTLREQTRTLTEQLEAVKKTYAYEKVSGKVLNMAKDVGFYDPADVLNYISFQGFGDDEAGDKFTETSLKAAVDEIAKKKPHLVKRAVAPVKDATPISAPMLNGKQKNFNDMTSAELEAYAKQVYSKRS